SAVERKHAFGDAVPISADDSAHIWRVVSHVARGIVVPENDVIELSVSIRNADRRHDAAIRYDAHFHAPPILQYDHLLSLRACTVALRVFGCCTTGFQRQQKTQ